MTDAVRLPDPEAAISRMPSGSGVILRHTDSRCLRELAERVVPLCRRRNLVCLVAGDWRLAARLGADGLHLPERNARMGSLAPALLWRRQGHRLMTAAAHHQAALLRAARLLPDGILLAPVFATESHPNARTLGAVRFAALVRRVRRPVLALGGITARTETRLAHSGAYGMAGIAWMK
jgi:thiamine-phosphate pyrophosphorylase